MPTKSNVTACFVVQGTDIHNQPFLHREFIWPSCDSPEHRRYLRVLMEQKAARMNKTGASVSVQYQELHDDGLWKEPATQNPRWFDEHHSLTPEQQLEMIQALLTAGKPDSSIELS